MIAAYAEGYTHWPGFVLLFNPGGVTATDIVLISAVRLGEKQAASSATTSAHLSSRR
jgi:hypothetical protein